MEKIPDAGYGPQQHPGERVRGTVRSAIEDVIARQPELRQPQQREQLLTVIAQYNTVSPLLARGVVTQEQLVQWTAEQLGEKPPGPEDHPTFEWIR